MTSTQPARDVDRPGGPTLPFEDLTDGLVLSPQQRERMTVITTPGSEPTYLMPAADFVAMQRERDQFRLTAHLINAWRLSPDRTESRLRTLLAAHGLGDGEARATLSLMAWAEDYRREKAAAQIDPSETDPQ